MVFSWLIFFEINCTSDGNRIPNECIFFRQDGATAHAACNLMVVLRKVLRDRIISPLSWSTRSCDCFVILKDNANKNNQRIRNELKKLSDAQCWKFIYKNFRE
jgi:hypothetical protein